MYNGVPASDGIGIGKVVIIKEYSIKVEDKKVSDIALEKERLKKAIDLFIENTVNLAENMKIHIGEKEAEILEGQVLIINDPEIVSGFNTSIDAGNCAEMAVEQTCNTFIELFASMEDEMFSQRATDVKDIKTRLLKILLNIEDIDISNLPENTILVAKDLTPSMTAGINAKNVVGIVTELGGKTSHSAILARALEIPAVLSIPNIVDILNNEDIVIVNGTDGIILINPNETTKSEYRIKYEELKEQKELLKKYIGKETITKDGKKIELVANIGKPSDIAKVLECDSEGIGLFRTEFLFMDRDCLPKEQEQFEAYKKVAEDMKGKPVIIRTLDIGGDKDIPYLGLEKEENPFLGFRAIRFCLNRKDIYREQLRALLRASAFGNIKIMLPLITCIEEVRNAKAMIEELKKEFDEKEIPYNKDLQVGVMIETPAGSLIADLLSQEVDFFSIGTNDLTQYTMAVDRGNAKVSYLYSTYNPAVLRSIKHIIEEAKKAGIMVGMCGEAASDKFMIPLLISFGLDEFSVSATSTLATRKLISEWSKERADELSQKVMLLKTETEVYEFLKRNIK